MAWGREDSTFDACLEVGSRLIVRLETKIREVFTVHSVLIGIFSMIVKLREGSFAALHSPSSRVAEWSVHSTALGDLILTIASHGQPDARAGLTNGLF